MFINNFLFGRPGNELSFDINPEAITVDEAPIAALRRNLAGDLRKAVIKTSAPTIKINSNYISIDQRNQFASFAGIQDTFLSFQTRDDWQVVSERNLITDLTHVTIQNNSATKLSQKLVAAGASSIITIDSISVVPNVVPGPAFGEGGFGDGGFPGPDYGVGGTYADATRVITLAGSLPVGTTYVYVTYTYKGWLVNLERLAATAKGGWVDRFAYDFQLTGV